MRARVSSLLCELHAHTTWSDGELSLPELVDLYGSAGFDVVCLTAHPYELGQRSAARHQTRYFARHWRELHGLYHRVELFNGNQLFGWVAEHGLAPVACGDLDRAEQFPGWTTLAPCEHDAQALVEYLRSARPVFLTRLEQHARPIAA